MKNENDYLMGLLLIGILILFGGLYFIYDKITTKINLKKGLKLYEFTKILIDGIEQKQKWFATDEEALKFKNKYQIISIIKPYRQVIYALK